MKRPPPSLRLPAPFCLRLVFLRLVLLRIAALVLGSLALAACDKPEAPAAKPANVTLITVARAETVDLEVREQAVGNIEGLVDPTVAAEIAARVVKVLVNPGQAVRKGQVIALLDPTDYGFMQREAESEVSRLETLLANQQRMVERNQRLVEKNFLSQTALDDVSTQRSALQQQLDAARSRLAGVRNTGSKTQVLAPADGIVEKQIVASGDYVKIGDPILQIIGTQKLRVHLPFPESVAGKLQPGMTLRLTTPSAAEPLTSTVRALKPLIGAGNRAVDVTADVVGQPGWQPGASVEGTVVLSKRDGAVVIPEQSLVLRPAGEVAYVIENNKAVQRILKTGLRQEGRVEVLQGVAAGEMVAADGAGFLTDGAEVNIQEPSQAATAP